MSGLNQEHPKAEIHDRGRGPEIKGTRITVYDVLDYHKHGWSAARIARLFRISVPQVRLAIKYIGEHKAEVWTEYREMLARDRKGNPPEIREKLKESRKRTLARLAEWRRLKKLEGTCVRLAG